MQAVQHILTFYAAITLKLLPHVLNVAVPGRRSIITEGEDKCNAIWKMFHCSKKKLVLLCHIYAFIDNISVVVLNLTYCPLKLPFFHLSTLKKTFLRGFCNGKHVGAFESSGIILSNISISTATFKLMEVQMIENKGFM